MQLAKEDLSRAFAIRGNERRGGEPETPRHCRFREYWTGAPRETGRRCSQDILQGETMTTENVSLFDTKSCRISDSRKMLCRLNGRGASFSVEYRTTSSARFPGMPGVRVQESPHLRANETASATKPSEGTKGSTGRCVFFVNILFPVDAETRVS